MNALVDMLADVKYALRRFNKSPGFTATAVVTLALGIGGTTAIFSLIHAVMLRSLPVADPGSLYRVGDGNDCCVEGGPQDRWGMYSFPLYERLKAESPEFEEVAAFQAGRAVSGAGRAVSGAVPAVMELPLSSSPHGCEPVSVGREPCRRPLPPTSETRPGRHWRCRRPGCRREAP